MQKILILLLLIVFSGIVFSDAFAYTITDDSTGGDCSTIGIWDSGSKTCTLSGDVDEGIVIGNNGITLDGDGHTVTGPGTTNDAGYGIHLNVKTNIIIKNIIVKDFLYGIFLQNSVINEIKDNTSLNNWSSQIRLEDSNDNIISNNILTGLENGYGILIGGTNNNVHDNTVTLNEVGIRSLGDDTAISNNIVENNKVGIDGTKNSLIEGNTVNSNSAVGIELGWGIDGSTVNNNIISNNELGLNLFGTNLIAFDNEISNNVLGLQLGHHATVYHNNLISNTVEAKMDQGSIASFNTSISDGGNYWSDYSPNCSDENHDNFCDESYPFKETMRVDDEYIWTVQDGWLTTITTPNDITLDATDSSGTSYDYSVSATHDGGSISVTCDPISGTIFPIGTTEVVCTANNGIKDTFSVTVNPLPPTINPSSPCDDGCTHEGNNLDLKIFASGNIENPIDGINSISSVWKDPTGIVVYDKTLQVNSQGQFNNEFDNPMYVRDMRDSGLYTTTYQYDDVTLEYTWNYITSVYVPEPIEDSVSLEAERLDNKYRVFGSISSTTEKDSTLYLRVSDLDRVEYSTGWNQSIHLEVGVNPIDETLCCLPTNDEYEVTLIQLDGEFPPINNQPETEPETEPTSNEFTVRTTKSSYDYNDYITIVGSVSNLADYSQSVTLVILSPDENIVSMSQIKPDDDGYYSNTVQAGGTMMVSGEYEIRAQYGSEKVTNTFYYSGGVSSPEPTPEPEPESEPEPTPEPGYDSIMIKNTRMTNAFGVTVSQITENMEFQLAADLTNTSNTSQSFIYFVEFGSEEFWINGQITPGQTLTPSITLSSESSGTHNYKIKIYDNLKQKNELADAVLGYVKITDSSSGSYSDFELDFETSGMTVLKIEEDNDFLSLLFEVDVTSSVGVLEVVFDREYFDSTFEGQDDDFIVLADGDEPNFTETNTNSQSRTLKIELPEGTEEIEIIGSKLNGNVSNDFPNQEPPEPYPEPEHEDHMDLEISAEKQVYDINSVAVLNISLEGNTNSQNVALDITDPRGTTIISRSISLGPDDSISFEFKIDENAKTGNYKVTATTSDGNRTEKDSTHFKVKSQFNAFKISNVDVTDQQGNPSDLEVGELGFIKVDLESNKLISTLVTVNIFDLELTSIGIGSVKTTLSSGDSEIILSFMIPDDAALGNADIFVNAFSDWPSNGGIPLTNEFAIVESIGTSSSEPEPKCGAGTVFDDVSNSCVLGESNTEPTADKAAADKAEKCGPGTVYDDIGKSCVLEGTQSTSNSIVVTTDKASYSEGDTIVITGKVSTSINGVNPVLSIFTEGNMIEIAQITLAQDGTYSHTVLAEGPLWKKSGSYTVRASYEVGGGTIAETAFEYSPNTKSIETNSIYEINLGPYGTFDIPFSIKGGNVKNMLTDSNDFALIVQIDATDDGSITLDLPRKFIGAEKQDGKDDIFIILIDGIDVAYEESVVSSESRKITINFEESDFDIKIMGTYVI